MEQMPGSASSMSIFDMQKLLQVNKLLGFPQN